MVFIYSQRGGGGERGKGRWEEGIGGEGRGREWLRAGNCSHVGTTGVWMQLGIDGVGSLHTAFWGMNADGNSPKSGPCILNSGVECSWELPWVWSLHSEFWGWMQLGTALSLFLATVRISPSAVWDKTSARIWKPLRSPGIDSASLCNLAGRNVK